MNIFGYIQKIIEQNQFANEKSFILREISGIEGAEGILSSMGKPSILAVDSTGDGSTYQARNGGMWIRRIYTIWLVRHYKYGDMEDYRKKMDECRTLFQQLHSRMLHDKSYLENNMLYIDSSTIQFHELAPEISSHYTGLYFMLQFDEPYDLSYDPSLWS